MDTHNDTELIDIIDSIRNKLNQVIANCDKVKENMDNARSKFAGSAKNLERIAHTCREILT